MHRGADGELEIELPAERALDALLSVCFDGEAGRARLDALCTDYDRVLGRLFDDDERVGPLRLLRADWALCEVRGEDGRRLIDRCAAGEVEGADPVAARELARSVVGAFELWVGKELWLRDRTRGICARLLDPVAAPRVLDPQRPGALWDARIVLEPKGARLCRAPFVYPEGTLEAIARREPARVPGTPVVTMPQLRRGWLRWARARRRQPFEL